jgi:hypothetical protein
MKTKPFSRKAFTEKPNWFERHSKGLWNASLSFTVFAVVTTLMLLIMNSFMAQLPPPPYPEITCPPVCGIQIPSLSVVLSVTAIVVCIVVIVFYWPPKGVMK